MKILINVINARNIGGGFQVVFNFILKTQEYARPDVEWYYAVSECLDSYLSDAFKDKVQKDYYFVYPDQPDFKGTYWHVKRELRELEKKINPEVVFSPLSPGYFFFKHKEVMRFANAWSTNATSYAWKTLQFKPKMRTKIYNIMQRALLRKAKYIITQTETVRGGLLRVTGLPENRVKVVPNVLPAILQDIDPSPLEGDARWVDIAAVGGQMPHKNLEIIPKVLCILKEKYQLMNVRFHTTLPADSGVWWRIENGLKAYGLEKNVVNHGNMRLVDLADMYKHCQFCFLPTVLETFSASTIEAMYFDLKTVASDLPFNKEVMQDACLYFEPMNAKSAAEKLAQIMGDKALQDELSGKMKERLKNYIDFRKYYDDTVDFLVKVGNGEL